ncbi:MAG: DNA cytosine methyltransferase [Chloroflexota bacterium]
MYRKNFQDFTYIDLFAGIGGIRLAFEAAGGQCVFSSEWDEAAQKTYAANFGDTPQGDITQIASADIPDHDILTGGFPCQPFSIIGQKLGFADTRGTLFFEIERILKDKQPHAFLLENVKQLKTHDKGRTFRVIVQRLEELGYFVHTTVLNALDFGLPQKRERTFFVGFKKNYHFAFPHQPSDQRFLRLDDILEPESDVPQKYFASEYIRNKRAKAVEHKTVFYPSIWHENKGGNIGINNFSCALRAGASFNYLLVNGIRRLTPREQLRLQGFPEGFVVLGSETDIRRQIGNSVPVKVVTEIARAMLRAMRVEQHEPAYFITWKKT